MKRKKPTLIVAMHYIRLVYRTLLFILLLVSYIVYRMGRGDSVITFIEKQRALLFVVWAVFVFEMVLRFFPSEYESPGCQKQFARNYIKSGSTNIVVQDNNATLLVALIWLILNGSFGALHMLGIFDDGIMILIASAYSICDIICILFFCPFQTWFLKNKCCGTCRIYNWDYAMMFTPLFFVQRTYLWSLLALSVALMIRWEITFYRHPERFSENTNEYLLCRNCKEKLCSQKKQLLSLWKQVEEYTARKTAQLRK